MSLTKSSFFYGKQKPYIGFSKKIKEFINKQQDLLSKHTSKSPRAVGDAIESLLKDNFQGLLGGYCNEYDDGFARRAMADMAYKDSDGFYCMVDVKTHNEETDFNMPNLTSVRRLAKLYEDNSNIFVILMIKYHIDEKKVIVSEVSFCPIEFLSWECLTIGALGWGQIQIANSNTIKLNNMYSRKKWMLELCDVMSSFYPKEIAKITERQDVFNSVRDFWSQKNDVWI